MKALVATLCIGAIILAGAHRAGERITPRVEQFEHSLQGGQ